MNRLKLFVSAVLLILMTTALGVNAESIMLEYDGGTHEYDGALFELYVKNKQIEADLEPIVFNNRALVPVREVFEEAGATVNYDANTQTVEILEEHTSIKMRVNDNIAYVNGTRTYIPNEAVPKLISKGGGLTKTMVPVRFISENIGMSVKFDGDNGAILIDSDDYEQLVPTATEEPIEPSQARPNITDVKYEMVEDHKIKIRVTTDSPIESYNYITMTDPERLVVDLPYGTLSIGEQAIKVNSGGINAIRMGQNSERARTVIDVDKLVSYGFETDGNSLIIYVRAEKNEQVQEPIQMPEISIKTDIPEPEPEEEKIVVNKNLIVLDPGHGGSDPGAIGTLNDKRVDESDLTLSISKKVKSILEKSGYTVVMTREDDTYKTLVERPTLANEYNAALFVSIHINSADAKSANGTEVYYASSNNSDKYGISSSQLAKNVLGRMLAYMGSTNRGVKTAEHAVTKRTNMPSCLVEVGFISNVDELEAMCSQDYQYKAAQGIAEGIIESAAAIDVD